MGFESAKSEKGEQVDNTAKAAAALGSFAIELSVDNTFYSGSTHVSQTVNTTASNVERAHQDDVSACMCSECGGSNFL